MKYAFCLIINFWNENLTVFFSDLCFNHTLCILSIWVPGSVDTLTWHIQRVRRTDSVWHASVQVKWRFSLACSQAGPGDEIFPLYFHFKFARDIGNEPVQETDCEEHKILKDDDKTQSNSENEEVLAVEIVRLDGIKVLLVPVKIKNK